MMRKRNIKDQRQSKSIEIIDTLKIWFDLVTLNFVQEFRRQR